MKPIVLTFAILAFLITSLYSVSMIAKNSDPLKVKTPRILRSISHSEEETFTVDLFVNTLHSMYIYEEAMIAHSLHDETGSTVLPITLESTTLRQSNEGGDILSLVYTLDIEASSETLHLRDALLKIDYSDNATLRIPIGEFSYLFEPETSESLDYTQSTPIKGDYGHGDTVVGHCLALLNKSEGSITIKDISLNSKTVRPNLDYLSVSEGSVHPLLGLKTILSTSFNPKSPSLAPKTHVLEVGGTATLCVPFTFEEAVNVKRYPVAVDYLEGETLKTMIIDDFTYMDDGYSEKQGVMRYGTLDSD
ncbi:MAG: hypothetical protein ACQEQA_03215 [Bacillota bacterium]